MSTLIPSIPLFPGTELVPSGLGLPGQIHTGQSKSTPAQVRGQALRALGLVGMVWVTGLLLSFALCFTGAVWLWGSMAFFAQDEVGISTLWQAKFWWGSVLLFSGAWAGYELILPWLSPAQKTKVWSEAVRLEELPEVDAALTFLCDKVGIQKPRDLEICFEANAGLELKAACQGKLKLRMGLPLLMGLNREQVRAVLAHELGHLQQGTALGLVLWLQRFCNALLPGLTEANHPIWTGISHLMIWAQGECVPLLHALEWDADEFARRIVPGNALDTAMLKLRSIEQAAAQSFRVVQASLSADTLPLDFVEVLQQELESLGQAMSDSLTRRALSQGAQASHPALRDRVTPSPHIPQKDVRSEAGSAPLLGLWTQSLTESFYRFELGEPLPEKRINAIDARCGLTSNQDTHATLEHYFYGLIAEASPIRPLPISEPKREDGLAAMNAVARLPVLRHSIAGKVALWRAGLGKLTTAEENFRHCTVESLRLEPPEVEAPIYPNSNYPQAHSDDLRAGRAGFKPNASAWSAAWHERESLAGELHVVSAQLSQQLDYGLALLHHPDVNGKLPEAGLWRKVTLALRSEIHTLARMLTALESASPSLLRLAHLDTAPKAWQEAWEEHARRSVWQALSQAMDPAVRQPLSETHLMQTLEETLGSCGRIPGHELVERFEGLYLRLSQAYLHQLGILAFAAGKAEIALGLRPWE